MKSNNIVIKRNKKSKQSEKKITRFHPRNKNTEKPPPNLKKQNIVCWEL